MTVKIKHSDEVLYIAGKEVYRDANGNWISRETLTDTEMKALRAHLATLGRVEESSTAQQRLIIHKLCDYDSELKAQLVASLTNDSKTSTKDLSRTEAQTLINMLTSNWGVFDKKKQQHRYILSLLHQMGWTIPSERWGDVPDTGRLSRFLKSKKSPVNKPLITMNKDELSKVIVALEGILKSTLK